MTTLYSGEIVSVDGHVWRMDIATDDPGAWIDKPGELTFNADESITLEWTETMKHDVIQGCAVTLNLESPGDRTYTHLYTVDINRIYGSLYRDGELYWFGQIDPEQYEEPYCYGSRYDVALTFSDFALFNRLDWELTGRMSLKDVLAECLSRVGLGDVPVQYNLDMAHYKGGNTLEPLGLDEFFVDCANFYDEDGVSMTLKDVLETVFIPLSIRIQQKDGAIRVYTLQALYNEETPELIEWDGDDSTLSVDAVYNKVTLTESPYVDSVMVDGEIKDALEDRDGKGDVYMTSNFKDDNCIDGFRITTATKSVMESDYPDDLKNCELGDVGLVFRISAIYSGSNETGFAGAFKSNDTTNYLPNTYDAFSWLSNKAFYANGGGGTTHQLVTVKGNYIVGGNGIIPNTPLYAYFARPLKVSLDVLFDVRYNPFEREGEYNEEGNYKRFQKWLNFGYVHTDLVVKDNAGNIIAWYDNSEAIKSGWPKSNTYNVIGQWKQTSQYPFQEGKYWLSYYDWEDRENNGAFNGWTTNRRALGIYKKNLPDAWQRIGDGDFIQLPPVSGWLEFTIYPDLYTNTDLYPYGSASGAQGYDYARWLLFREPKIELVDTNGKELDDDLTGDIVISAWLNRSAADELELDLKYYTADNGIVGRAAILDADGNPMGEFFRGGHSKTAEHHLIGMIYSHYATPHTVLSGTCVSTDSQVLTDTHTPSKLVVLSELMDVRMGTSTIKAVELSEEMYDGIEYE